MNGATIKLWIRNTGVLAALCAASASFGCLPGIPQPGDNDNGNNNQNQNDNGNDNDNGNQNDNDNQNGNDNDNDNGDFETKVLIDGDDNNIDNPVVQPQDPALAGGGIDQSLQNGGILIGTHHRDVMIGGLGEDTFLAEDGPDVIIGGIEAGAPPNRDRAFGGRGADVFIWQAGDGSDFFDGGPGIDALVFGPITQVENGLPREVFLDPDTSLPLADCTGSPGFCEVIDPSISAEVADELDFLGLDHLVRFFARGPADSFEAGDQADDNGLRVTIHVRSVEFVICTVREGGAIEVLDLRTSPPTLSTLEAVAEFIPDIERMVK